MLDPKHPLAELLKRDRRYHFDSYVFVFDSLRFAQEKLNMGRVAASPPGIDVDQAAEFDEEEFTERLAADEAERHISGQDLCEAIRQYALTQYGLLAQSVFNHWGIHSTDDFGEIVFNLIDIGQMRKTDNDRREDFTDVYDFADALTGGAVFTANDDEEPSC